MANVDVKYYWTQFENEVETRMIISLDDYPYSSFTIDDKDWLTAESFYVKFSTGYNEFLFDEQTQTLIFKCENTSKLGDYYKVEISEVL